MAQVNATEATLPDRIAANTRDLIVSARETVRTMQGFDTPTRSERILNVAGLRIDRDEPAAPDEPRRVLMVSVSDGKIGSVYTTAGRIRTTHTSGPAVEPSRENGNLRYSMHVQKALDAFSVAMTARAGPVPEDTQTQARSRQDMLRRAANLTMERAQGLGFARLPTVEGARLIYQEANPDPDRWAATELLNAHRAGNPPPDWLTEINDVDALPTIEQLRADEPQGPPSRVLFEFIPERLERANQTGEHGWHYSRGTPVQISLPQHSVRALATAADLASEVRGNPALGNRIFFDYLVEHAPDLANQIRDPSNPR